MATAKRVVLAVDNVVAAGVALEASVLLAHLSKFELDALFVESTQALQAAALPFAQALSHAGASWSPLLREDVELGFRAQAEQLRRRLAELAARHDVSWTLRVVRGVSPRAALELPSAADLLLLAMEPPQRFLAAPLVPATRRRAVVVQFDDSAAGERALRIASDLAAALSAPLRVVISADDDVQFAAQRSRVRAASAGAEIVARNQPPVDAALLVLTRGAFDERVLAALPCPVLLVT